jgi:hypothetical protein
MKAPFAGTKCVIYYTMGEPPLTVTINHDSAYDAIKDGWTSYDQNAGQERVWINLAHCRLIIEEVDDGR